MYRQTCDKWGWFTVGNKTDQTCSPAEGRAPCHMLRYLGTEVQGALGRWRERGANATGQLKSFRRQWNVSWPLGDEWEFAKWGGKIMGPGRDLFQAVGIEGATFQGSRFWGKFRKNWYMSARGLGGRWKVAGSWHGQPGGQVRWSSYFNLSTTISKQGGWFFCHCPQLSLVFYKKWNTFPENIQTW